jgi:hypothetical protein
MRTDSISNSASAASGRALRPRASWLACAACATLALLFAPGVGSASAASPPKYTLTIVEGETTLPEFGIAGTSGGDTSSRTSVAVSIARGGIVIARSTGEGSAGMSQTPQVGDVVSLEAPIGSTVGAVVYDGLPSIDPTVCAGSTNFSGQNSTGETVKGGYFTETPKTPYYPERTGFGRAQVTILSGTSFGGSFLSPLSLGQTVYALESLETPLAGGAVFDYVSENYRPVGACPPPPPVILPPPPPPALQGTLLALARTTILRLLKHGWHDQVTINQPGTVIQDLYLENGKLPAHAASSGKHHVKIPPALLLARGVVTAKSAGTISLVLKLTYKGRRKLESAKSAKVELITTLHSSSGSELNLPRHSISLHR